MLISLIFALHTQAHASPTRVRALQCRAQLEVARVRGGAAEDVALTGDQAFDGLISRGLKRLNLEDQMLLLEIAFELREVLGAKGNTLATESLLGHATAELTQYMYKIGRPKAGEKVLQDVQRRAIAIKDDLG